MVTYDYRDLDTGAEAEDPEAGAYSVVALMHEHQVRYVLRTSRGAIVLRHLPLRMARVIESVRRAMYPGVADLEARFEEARKAMDPSTATEDQLAEFLRLDRQLAMSDMTALGVIVAPVLTGMEDYEELYEKLDDVDRLRLTTAVRALASPLDPSKVDGTAEAIAQRYGIQLVDRETVEELTVSQAAYLVDRIVKEARAIDRQRGTVKVRRWPTSTHYRRTPRRPPAH